ncbi:MAG TPA: RluA family pseudouridine synthase [Pyrinomonadaceae bacterium]|jgi:23S rRNA pseudouridine1911/1915/1917 synthase
MKESLQFHIDVTPERRLDEFLWARLGWLSRMRIASLLVQGACTVNDAAAHAGYHIKSGDVVKIELDDGAPTAMNPEPVPLEIIYEDDHLLVVVKPTGMLVHPTRGVKRGTLANALAYHLNRLQIAEFGLRNERGARGLLNPQSEFRNLQSKNPQWVRPGIVHRLDRATSGLIVVTKRQRALSILARHFHQRLVEKRYLALVEGCVAEDVCLISAPIGRDPEGQPKWRVMEDGKPAETRLRVLRRSSSSDGGMTLVELEPVTGRTNQLRIHCAHLGHPIIGDEWYGAQSAATRLCLHAARLAFHHPANGAWMEFASPLPAEVAGILRAAGP